jgi:hypothetical protein
MPAQKSRGFTFIEHVTRDMYVTNWTFFDRTHNDSAIFKEPRPRPQSKNIYDRNAWHGCHSYQGTTAHGLLIL